MTVSHDQCLLVIDFSTSVDAFFQPEVFQALRFDWISDEVAPSPGHLENQSRGFFT